MAGGTHEQPPRRVAIVSYRLGGTDGVSIEAAKWAQAFEALGADVVTIAGSGCADVIVGGLGAEATGEPVDRPVLRRAFRDADLVVVENCCSLPLNPRAGDAIARELAGRRAVLRHHDLPWQRQKFRDCPPPPDDGRWLHVTINERSRLELAARGVRAATIYNCFDPDPPEGARDRTRGAFGLGKEDVLVLQPTRAIGRKNVPGGILLARAIGATYWLLGPAEDGYGPELGRILDAGRRLGTPIVHGAPEQTSISDAYAACDAVVLPSTWEGFGNPAVESAMSMRPLAIGSYPVSFELRRYGFRWYSLDEATELSRFLAEPDNEMLDHNRRVARARFSTAELPERLSELLQIR